jgi:hypothetical protein
VLLYARETPGIKTLFQDDKVYINYHLLKSQSIDYNNMRKNKMLPMMGLGMMGPGMPMNIVIYFSF